MSNSLRVVEKHKLRIEINNLREALTRSDENLRDTSYKLQVIEEAYIRHKREVKSITDKTLFRGLYSAFLLWKGERRF